MRRSLPAQTIPIALERSAPPLQHRRRLANGESVEGGDRAREALERELTDRFDLDVVFHFGVEPLRDQDLAAGGLVGEPRREIRDRADRRIVGALLEADFATRCIAERDARPEIQVVAALVPARSQLSHLLSEGAAHAYRP